MRNTHIDLDIAFVDARMDVIAVLRMLADTRDLHRPEHPYLAAIEAPAGWYEAHGIGPGAQVEVRPRGPRLPLECIDRLASPAAVGIETEHMVEQVVAGRDVGEHLAHVGPLGISS